VRKSQSQNRKQGDLFWEKNMGKVAKVEKKLPISWNLMGG
jgi:hypothetical protein